MSIEVEVQYASRNATTPTSDEIREWVAAVLDKRLDKAQLTIRIVSELEMTQLNEKYRGKSGATNVLAFPFDAPPGVSLPLLGDIVVCDTVVAHEAQSQGKCASGHWCHMVVHGVLHLLGYDHIESGDASEMEQLERRILSVIGYADPYREDASSLAS